MLQAGARSRIACRLKGTRPHSKKAPQLVLQVVLAVLAISSGNGPASVFPTMRTVKPILCTTDRFAEKWSAYPLDMQAEPWDSHFMIRLLLLFIFVPIVELALLIELGRYVGTLPTLGLIAITGLLGATLARRQGLGVWRQVQSEMASGQVPAGSIVNGLIILLAGALLITPGILTDTVGFLCLIPASRDVIKRVIWRRLERALQEGTVRVSVRSEAWGNQPPPGPIYDVRPKSDAPESSTEPRRRV